MDEIDLRPGTKDYRVSTTVEGPNGKYDRRMGPDVVVTARDENHAKELVKQSGRDLNPHFPPVRVRR